MKWPSILSDLGTVLRVTAETLAENPKTTAFVSAYSFAAGLSAFVDWFVVSLPTLAIFAGFLGAVILAHLNWKKMKLVELEALKLKAETELANLRTREQREKMAAMEIEMREKDRK